MCNVGVQLSMAEMMRADLERRLCAHLGRPAVVEVHLFDDDATTYELLDAAKQLEWTTCPGEGIQAFFSVHYARTGNVVIYGARDEPPVGEPSRVAEAFV